MNSGIENDIFIYLFAKSYIFSANELFIAGLLFASLIGISAAIFYSQLIKSIVKKIDPNERSINSIQQKHNWVFENIYDIYFEVSLDYKLTYLSNSFEKVTKYKINNVVGKNVSDFFRDSEQFEFVTKELHINGVVNKYEIKLFDYNNEQLDCLITLMLLRNNDKPLKICGIIHDITERKKSEQLIFENEKRYKSLIELSPNPIFVIQNQKFVFGNPATFELLKCNDIQSIISKTPMHFVYKEDRAEFVKYLRRICLGKQHTPTELRIVDYNNNVINVLSHAITITFEDKPAYLFVMQEITKIKHYEKELIRAKAKAEESDRLKSSFLANMSHEIRTPLNGIIGFASLIRKPNISHEKLDTYTQIIQSASHQLLGLINDIIDISKIEAGQMVVNNDKLNINTLMDEMFAIYMNQAEKKGIEMKVEKGLENENAEIVSDETKIKQIFNNLLNNALKFTEKGSIYFSYKIFEKQIIFSVADTGIGIPDESKTAVFERFRQLESTDNRRFGGTGLGLSICKALVDMMGGKIKIEDNHPKGTIFIFNLPYLPVKVISGDSFNDNLRQIVPDWSGKTILIAEDEETNFFFLEEIIEETNAKILYADNGLKAIELFNKNPEINLALLDIKMPELDGYCVLKQLKLQKPELPVIAQTAYAMSNEKQKVFESGFNNYISKPIDRILFYKMLNTYLKR